MVDGEEKEKKLGTPPSGLCMWWDVFPSLQLADFRV